MNRVHRLSLVKILSIISAGLALLTWSAQAQQWQSVYGGALSEGGRGGVKPLAAGNGYISVGYTNSTGLGTDVFVVEETLGGGIIWGFAYDFGGSIDQGYDIQELAGGGFIITGSTNINGNNDLFLLQINAAGGVVWAETFGGANQDAGLDVLQAANGDIVAAGFSFPNAANNSAGFVVRTTVLGAPIWTNTYEPVGGGANEDLRGLDECANGDLVVCGGTASFGNAQQAWIMRLFAGGGVSWSNHVGGLASNEGFNSVIELGVGGQAGNIVAAGSTTAPAPLDFYAAKFNAGGGMIAPDVSGGTAAGVEEVFQIREALVNNPGDLLLVGHMTPGPIANDDDGYVIDMQPVWACPIGKNWTMCYGGIGVDQLYSIDEDANNCIPGFIICGLTASGNLLPAGDPGQKYIIKANNVGVSGCNEARPIDRCTQPNFPTNPAAVVPTPHQWRVVKNVTALALNTFQALCFTACPPVAPGRRPGGNGIVQALSNQRPWTGSGILTGGGADASHDAVSSVPGVGAAGDATAAYPNPVRAGSSFQVRYTLAEGTHVAVVVSDISGRIVFDRKAEAANGLGDMMISTAGWAEGSYLVRVDLGSEVQTKRIVVTGK